MKILLVDDDAEIAQLVSRRLEYDNYVVEIATDGEYAIDLLQVSDYGLILLDLMLPKLDGIQVCQKLRNLGDNTPILMLTGQDHTRDKVTGLDAGADDYLVKPFELDELTARVRALLRRDSGASSAVITHGPLQFDASSQTLTFLEKTVSLRPKELSILELMLHYPHRVFEPDTFLDQLWDLGDCPGKATVKSHIRSIRKQLAAVGADNLIETVYGKGYRLNSAFLDQFEGDRTPCQQPSASASSPKAILDETWRQVQSMCWHRLSRLEALVQSLGQTEDFRQRTRLWQEDCKKAAMIAHQLKGTLGSFGFQTASLQAKHIEELLCASGQDSTIGVALLQDQVKALQHLLQEHMTEGPQPTGLPSLKTAQVLVATYDQGWAKSLQRQGQDGPFQIEVCSPLDINGHLLAQTPAAILLELSRAKRSMDLSLLDALVSNYGEQVSVLVVLESPQPDEQLVAIHHGASAIALKNWSIKTLLSILAEYTHPHR